MTFLPCSRGYKVGTTEGLLSGSGHVLTWRRLQRGEQLPKVAQSEVWSGVCRRSWCSAGWAAMAGAELCRDGPCRVLLSSMHAHAAPAPAAPSGRRHGRAPRGAGRQPCRRALLCPEAVVVLWGKARERNRGTVGIADEARARVHGHMATWPRSHAAALLAHAGTIQRDKNQAWQHPEL